MNNDQPPRRRYRFDLQVQADDFQQLVATVTDALANGITPNHGETRTGVGHSYHLDVVDAGERMTPERYREELTRWVTAHLAARQDKAREPDG